MTGYGGEGVSIVTVVYPCGKVSVSSHGSFLSVGYYSKTFYTSFTLYLGICHIQEYLKKKRGRKRKLIRSQKYKDRHDDRIKLSKVIVQVNLVVGYCELISMESGAE